METDTPLHVPFKSYSNRWKQIFLDMSGNQLVTNFDRDINYRTQTFPVLFAAFQSFQRVMIFFRDGIGWGLEFDRKFVLINLKFYLFFLRLLKNVQNNFMCFSSSWWDEINQYLDVSDWFYEMCQLATSLFEFPMWSSFKLWWLRDDDEEVAGVVPDDELRLPTTEALEVPLTLVDLGPQILTVPSSELEANIDG